MTARTRRPRPSHLTAEHHHRTGRRLASLRQDAGFSQAALGRALGRTQNAVAQIETGVTRMLFADAVEIAVVLGIDVRLLDPDAALANAPRGRSPRPLGRPTSQLRLPLGWPA